MITHLKGTIEKITDNSLVLDVHGVGYQLLCSSRTLESVSRCNEIVHIYTVMNIREDGWILYGFADERERSWFNMLISVQGVGGKVALAILSALSTDEIYSAFCSEDKVMLTRADGVGAKLATRILSELKDKVLGKGMLAENTILPNTITVGNNTMVDVVSALENLGYQRSDAMRIVSNISAVEQDLTFDTLLRRALAKIATGT